MSPRLEGVNKQFGTSICISDSVFEAVKAHVLARPLRKLRVKGRQQEFMPYELLGMRETDDPELAIRDGDEELCALTSIASAHLVAGRIEQAIEAYGNVLAHCPGDGLARTMLDVMPVPEVGRRPVP